MSSIFPFSAIVGQSEMKLALQLSIIDQSLGGVMVFGDRGTGKTTAMRGLAGLLPAMKVVKNCRYQCDPNDREKLCSDCLDTHGKAALPIATAPVPVVDLPLGVTEDRVVGALDIEKALSAGIKTFEPGILAAANRGFLYIDEVNLLEDHIVDVLLDVAVSGVNVVERDGLSVRHPARFLLVGSGNPEEGELRPQLLDRFGLSVEVSTPTDIEQRMQIVRLRDEFDNNPKAFTKRHNKKDKAIARQLKAARRCKDQVLVDDDALRLMAQLCNQLQTDGLRGEITLMRACRAYAALLQDDSVTETHIRQIAPMALRHRLRRDPLDDSGSKVRIERALDQVGLAA